MRSILITGAARGIGLASARLFAGRGWRVGMYDVDAAAATDAAADVPHATAGGLDVRDAEQWQDVLREFCHEGRLDVLMSNAGVLDYGSFASTPADAHRRAVEVNLLGCAYGAQAAHPYLRQARGLLLTMCSASALYGQPGIATYSATKAGVRSLTEALDLEWASDGIRVRSLVPLYVATAMVDEQEGSPGVRRLGVRLRPEDVAAAAWRVAHERASRLRSPHRAVGAQTRAVAVATALSPAWANRLVTRRLTR